MLKFRARLGILMTLAMSAGCSDDATTGEPPVAALELATRRAPTAIVDREYSLDVAARGGVRPYAFELQGAPAGLSIATDSGVLSGTPTETGTFTLTVLVTDSAGAQAEGTLALEVIPLEDGPELMVFDGTCEAPTVLMPTSGVANLVGRLPASTESNVLCGGGDRASAYFQVSLTRRSSVRVGLTASLADVAIGRALPGCPTLRLSEDICGRVLSETLPAGDHSFLLFGPPGAEFAMTVEVERVDDTGAPSCEAPEVVDLSGGPAVLMGTWTDARDEQTPATCGAVAPGAEVVYEVALTEPSDLVIEPTSSVRTYVRTADCRSGREEACDQGFGTRRLLNHPADTYYLFVEAITGTEYQLRVEAAPPTLPATNFSCSTAEPLDVSGGTAAVRGDFANVPVFDSGSMCGNADNGLYYAFQLPSPATLTLPGLPQGVQAELLLGDCSAPLASLSCIGSNDGGLCSPNLAAGDYILRLSTSFGAPPPFDLTLTTGDPRAVPLNISCAAAEVVTATPAVVMGSVRDAPDTLSLGACGSNDAGDLYYRLDLAERADVTVDMLGGNTRFSYAIYTGDCGNLQQVDCGTAFNELTALSVPAGPVTVVVEPRVAFIDPFAFDDESQQSFEMRIEAASLANAPPNDSCASPTVVGFPRGIGSAEVVPGTTRAASNNHDSVVCPFGAGTSTVTTSGPDVVYAVDLPVAGRLRAAVLGADAGTRVALLTACDGTGGATLCDAFNNTLETERALAAGRYFVRVDHGNNSSPTDFFLLLTLLP